MSIPTRILIISDTHDQWPYSDSNPAPKVDVLLHCGDLTQVGGLPAFRRAIENIKAIDAELKLVIAGNHDLELDEKWVRDNIEGEDELEDSANVIAFFKAQKTHGVHYLEEGTHTFTLKHGANFTIYASPYTPEFNGYAFAYGTEDRFSSGTHSIPENVDIVMTHGPPILESSAYKLDINRKGDHCGCGKLAKAIQRVKPRLHCFGHLHEGRGAAYVTWNTDSAPHISTLDDRNSLAVRDATAVKETLMVNAAMQDGQGSGMIVDVVL
jgi:Icc-related predicted phosphoesterase